MQNFEVMMQRAVLFELAVLLLVLIASVWISYEVLKRAIRDGITEAMSRRWFEPATPKQLAPTAPEGFKWELVKSDAKANTRPMDFSAHS